MVGPDRRCQPLRFSLLSNPGDLSMKINTDSRVRRVLDAAERNGVFVSFHLEPCVSAACSSFQCSYPGRSVESIASDLQYISRQYSSHGAIFKKKGKPLFYVYDSYHIEAQEWARLLTPSGRASPFAVKFHAGDLSIRGHDGDGIFIGLWLDSNVRKCPFVCGDLAAWEPTSGRRF